MSSNAFPAVRDRPSAVWPTFKHPRGSLRYNLTCATMDLAVYKAQRAAELSEGDSTRG